MCEAGPVHEVIVVDCWWVFVGVVKIRCPWGMKPPRARQGPTSTFFERRVPGWRTELQPTSEFSPIMEPSFLKFV